MPTDGEGMEGRDASGALIASYRADPGPRLPNGRLLIDELRIALRVHGKHSEMCYTVPATPENPRGLGTCVCGLNYDLKRLGA